jgi:hypothetical protein
MRLFSSAFSLAFLFIGKPKIKVCRNELQKTSIIPPTQNLSPNQTRKSLKKAIKILRSRKKELLVKIPKEAFLPLQIHKQNRQND